MRRAKGRKKGRLERKREESVGGLKRGWERRKAEGRKEKGREVKWVKVKEKRKRRKGGKEGSNRKKGKTKTENLFTP